MAERELLYAGSIATRTPWHLSSHRHDHHELVVLVEGEMRLRIDHEDETVAVPGDALLYRAGRRHEESSRAGQPFHTHFIGFTDLDLDDPRLPVRVADQAGRLRQLARWLYDEHGAAQRRPRNTMTGAACNAFLAALTAEFRRLTQDNTPPLVREIRSYVVRRLANPIFVDDLASHAGMSKYHFIRTYRKIAGCTPMAAVRTLRVETARDLILTTDLPLKQIAEHCGLGTPQHFSRIFRERFGRPPATFSAGAASGARPGPPH